MRKKREKKRFLPGIEPAIFEIFNELFNEPVSSGKQFNFARNDAQLAFYLTTNDK
tara:strand:- start:124 stop:288 length:165 start_codon:yes stop_codon:yes gene_type:complete